MKRGCFLSLAIWAACSYGYWYFTHGRLIPPLDKIGPIVAGLIMTLVIGAVRNAIGSARDAIKLGRTIVPGERPNDGDLITVSGHVRSSGSPLRAPISGKPAVLYSYEISHMEEWRDSTPSRVTDFAGFGAASPTIDSTYGPIRLLGFPMLDAFAKQSVTNGADAAAKYVAETEWTQMTGFHPTAIFHEIKDLMTDDEGRLRKDWRMKDQADVTGEDLIEQIVAPGDAVTAIGRYSAQKGGLVHDSAHPLRLMPGDATVAASAMWGKMASSLIGAVIFAAILNGVIFGVLKLQKAGRPYAVSTVALRESAAALHEAARTGDVAKVEQLITHGLEADTRDEERATPLMRAANADIASMLIAHGADINAANSKGETALMKQSELGHADVVKLLVKSGANIDARSANYKLTALQLALENERLDVARVLREAGATDNTVTATNGETLTDTSAPVRVVREYLDAVQREDRKALSDLSTFGSFDGVDFKTWKATRFANGRFVSGFANAHNATVMMRGPVPSGVYVTWTYQLVERDGAWKMSDERWETRLSGSAP